MFKRLLALGAAAGGAYAMVNKRKKTAAAEARLWDEATGRSTPAPTTSASTTASAAGSAITDPAPAAGSNGVVGS
jgi:hypothetical protein